MRPERSSSGKLRASWVDLPAPAAKVVAAVRAAPCRVAFGRRRLELSLCTVALAIAAGSIALVAVEADPGGAPRGGPPVVVWLASGGPGVAGPAGLAPAPATGAGAGSADAGEAVVGGASGPLASIMRPRS